MQIFPTVTRHVTVAVVSIYSADTAGNGGDPVTVIVVSEVVIRRVPVGAVAFERGYVTVAVVGDVPLCKGGLGGSVGVAGTGLILK